MKIKIKLGKNNHQLSVSVLCYLCSRAKNASMRSCSVGFKSLNVIAVLDGIPHRAFFDYRREKTGDNNECGHERTNANRLNELIR